jgi:hypothetical protein
VTLYEADLTLGPICTLEHKAEDLALLAISPDDSIVFWWDSPAAELEEDEPCAEADRLPKALQLGLGRLHSSLLPFLTEQGMEAVSPADGVYGAYIGFNTEPSTDEAPGTAFVLGYAQLDMSGTGAQPEPSADPSLGVFAIEGIFLFPLAPESDTGIDHGAQ